MAIGSESESESGSGNKPLNWQVKQITNHVNSPYFRLIKRHWVDKCFTIHIVFYTKAVFQVTGSAWIITDVVRSRLLKQETYGPQIHCALHSICKNYNAATMLHFRMNYYPESLFTMKNFFEICPFAIDQLCFNFYTIFQNSSKYTLGRRTKSKTMQSF